MPDPETSLRLATPEELEFTLTQALLRDGKKNLQSARELSAGITAAHLLDQLRKQGYIVMKKPGLGFPGVPAGKPTPNRTD